MEAALKLRRQKDFKSKSRDLSEYGILMVKMLIEEGITPNSAEAWLDPECEQMPAFNKNICRALQINANRLTVLSVVDSTEGLPGVEFTLKVAAAASKMAMGVRAAVGHFFEQFENPHSTLLNARPTEWLARFWIPCYEMLCPGEQSQILLMAPGSILILLSLSLLCWAHFTPSHTTFSSLHSTLLSGLGQNV